MKRAVDWVVLGGGSLVLLPLLALARPASALPLALLATLLVQPHFLHSYQLAYARFRERLLGDELPAPVRARYAFATLGVPLLFVAAFATLPPSALGVAVWAMLGLTGWHYAKQGFGILMLEAGRARRWASPRARQVLVWNCYACAVAAALRHRTSGDFMGLRFDVPVPAWLATGTLVVAAASTTLSLLVVLRARLFGPGLLAYVASVYVWLFAQSPAAVLWIPACHALQYYAVVWRLRWRQSEAEDPIVGLGTFLVAAVLGSAAAFWLLPLALDRIVPREISWTGPVLLLLNVHHYFLDHVIWRKENADMRRWLFTPPATTEVGTAVHAT